MIDATITFALDDVQRDGLVSWVTLSRELLLSYTDGTSQNPVEIPPAFQGEIDTHMKKWQDYVEKAEALADIVGKESGSNQITIPAELLLFVVGGGGGWKEEFPLMMARMYQHTMNVSKGVEAEAEHDFRHALQGHFQVVMLRTDMRVRDILTQALSKPALEQIRKLAEAYLPDVAKKS